MYHVCICLKAPSRPICSPSKLRKWTAFAELDQAALLQPQTICKNCPVRTVTAVNCEGSGKNLKYRRYSLCTSRQPVALSFLPEAIDYRTTGSFRPGPGAISYSWRHLSRWSPVSKTQVRPRRRGFNFQGDGPPGKAQHFLGRQTRTPTVRSY